VVPLKDAIPTDRAPLVTFALVAAGLAEAVVRGDVLLGLLAAAGLWWFGPVVEDATSRPRFALLCAAGAGAAIALGGLGLTGVAAAAAGASLALHPRGAIVTLALSWIVELPTALLAPVWAAGLIALGAPPLAVAAAAAAGVPLALVLARRRPAIQPRVPVY
jgi:hypothetical protein